MPTLLSGARYLAAALLVANSLSTVAAADPCLRPAEKTAFTLIALKSELMVTAITCQAEDRYNSFVTRFRADLQGGEKGINTYFNRTAGKHALQTHDDYITALANTQSEDGLRQGTDFCDKHLPMLNEVLALRDSSGLASYATAATVVQAIDITECPPPPDKKIKTVAKASDTTTASPSK